MSKQTGLYICSGCDIGESLDLKALASIAIKEYNIPVCKDHHFLCGDEAVKIIKEDILKKSIDTLVICACSPRAKSDTFSFGKNIQIERVNLREQVVWSHQPGTKDTQMLAEDYVRMGIAKTEKTSIPKPYINDNLNADILVVGGGITGITAAIESAKAGYKVILVEKEKKLGGWAGKLFMQVPLSIPYDQLEDPIIYQKMKELEEIDSITVFTSSAINSISGEPGLFKVNFSTNGNSQALTIGAIISATGWNPYDATKLTELGYNSLEDVITGVDLEVLAKTGKITRPSDNKEVKSVLFVQCAGSRDEKHLPYCSNFCCMTSLKQARYIRSLNEEANVYIIYQDIRTPGQYEQFYQQVQRDERIFLTKGTINGIHQHNGQILVNVQDTLLGEKISIGTDMVVLATGMTPNNSEELNLSYRQGKGLPVLKYDFPDSHFICFPYETRRTGIYAAGALRAPMDIAASMEDATGAALKAIQCIESAKKGESVHPRSGDQSYPHLYLDRCTDCKRCTEECPFGAYDETEKGTPLSNPNRCRRCGICLGACPERIINFDDFSIDSISSMIKAVYIPDEFEEKPRILIFVCENDAYPALDIAGQKRLEYSPFVRIIPVRCIGSINKAWITDALSRGFDGILQIGCKPGDDYQCHFIQGSELTKTRAENYQEALETMMLEPERVQTEFVEIDDYDKIPEIINNYVELIDEIGPNPFKDL